MTLEGRWDSKNNLHIFLFWWLHHVWSIHGCRWTKWLKGSQANQGHVDLLRVRSSCCIYVWVYFLRYGILTSLQQLQNLYYNFGTLLFTNFTRTDGPSFMFFKSCVSWLPLSGEEIFWGLHPFSESFKNNYYCVVLKSSDAHDIFYNVTPLFNDYTISTLGDQGSG